MQHIFSKHLIIAAVSAGLLAFSGAPAMAYTTAAAPAVTQTVSLQQGSYGPSVSHLQTQLKNLGFFTYPSITGYYGSMTAAAVRDFQAAYGLAADGIAGAYTQPAIDRAVIMKRLAQDAAQYTGIPYQWGGASPATGFDCSGFIYYMYKVEGLSLERVTSQRYASMGTPVDRAHLQPGDLVFFNIDGPASHMGIYTGGGNWISATYSKGVWTYTLDNPYWAARYGGARRI